MIESMEVLSPSKRMFVLEYLKDFVITRTAERLGISPSTASKYLGELDVQAAIAGEMADRALRTSIDSDWVLVQLSQMFQADLADIFIPGTNDVRPVHEWPEIWRKMSTGVKVDDRGSADNIYTVKDVKIMDRLKALEMIGKHTDVRAFLDRVIVATDQELTEKLMAGRKRARERNGVNVTVNIAPEDFI